MLSHWCEAKPIDLAWRRPGRRGSKSARGCMGVIRKGGRLLIKHAFPAQCAFESLGGWSIRRGFRSAHLTAVSAVTHSRVRTPCMSMNGTASQRSTIMAGRAQT
jgi:hypothetical protein